MPRDPEYLAFIRSVHAAAVAPPAPIAEERAALERSLAALPRTPMASQRDLALDGRFARMYVPEDATGDVLVFFHGGGWYLGSVAAYDAIVQALAAASRTAFVSVETRLAPEHPFPAAVEDAIAALRAARERFGEVGVAGDSSGGNLAAVAARHVPVSRQVLIYPALDLRAPPPLVDDPDGFAWPDHAQTLHDRYLAGHDPADPDVSPLLDPAPASALVVTCEYDRGREQAHAFVARHPDARLLDFDGLDHAFLAWGAFARRPREAIDRIGEAIRRG